MTAAPLPDALRTYLADPRVRRSLASLVQTRVPARDAEDVVQSVLCAALAAESVPEEASHLPRWIAGIARHKVADAHRRAYREPPLDEAHAHAESELEAPAPAFEARQLAARVAAEAAGDADATRTLEWIAREHEGETWAEIAKTERLPGAVVRKRISRFRRALRLRWRDAFGVSGAASVLAVVLAVALAASREGARDAIAPDDGVAHALVELGDWRVDRVDLDAATAPELRALAELEAMGMRVHIERARDATRVRVTCVTCTVRSMTYRVLSANAKTPSESHSDAPETLLLRDEAGRDHRVVITHGDSLRVRVDEGKWHGTLTLRRD